jgi:hypothetical protein
MPRRSYTNRLHESTAEPPARKRAKRLPTTLAKRIRSLLKVDGTLEGSFVLLPDGELLVGDEEVIQAQRRPARWETHLTIRAACKDEAEPYDLVVFSESPGAVFTKEQDETISALARFLDKQRALRTKRKCDGMHFVPLAATTVTPSQAEEVESRAPFDRVEQWQTPEWLTRMATDDDGYEPVQLRLEEVAVMCRVSLSTIKRRIRTGDLKVLDYSHVCKRVKWDDLRTFLDSLSINTGE